MTEKSLQELRHGEPPADRQRAAPDAPLERMGAREAFEAVQESSVELCRHIKEEADLPAYAAPLPLVPRPQKGKAAKPANPLIPPQLFELEARDACIHTIQALTMDPDQSPKHVRRCPGLIASSAKTLRLAHHLNGLKDALKSAVLTISPSRFVRQQEIAKIIPYFSAMQSYRNVVILDQRPRHVSFTWATLSAGTKRVTAGSVRVELEQMRASPPPHKSLEEWEAWIDFHLQRFIELNIPDREVLAFRETTAPHPRANFYYANNETAFVAASLPILYPHQEGMDIVGFTPLSTLDLRVPKTQRSNRELEKYALVERLNIYRYQASVREEKMKAFYRSKNT